MWNFCKKKNPCQNKTICYFCNLTVLNRLLDSVMWFRRLRIKLISTTNMCAGFTLFQNKLKNLYFLVYLLNYDVIVTLRSKMCFLQAISFTKNKLFSEYWFWVVIGLFWSGKSWFVEKSTVAPLDNSIVERQGLHNWLVFLCAFKKLLLGQWTIVILEKSLKSQVQKNFSAHEKVLDNRASSS